LQSRFSENMAQTVVLPDGKSLEFAVTERKPGASSEADPVGVILMPGASGDRDSGHLPDTAQALADAGFTTLRFHLQTSLGKRAAACRALLEHGRAQICQRWILAGHSMVRADGM